MKRFPLDASVGEVFRMLIPSSVREGHHWRHIQVNGLRAGLFETVLDTMRDDYTQEICLLGTRRQYSLELRSEAEFLSAFSRLEEYRILHLHLDSADVVVVVRESDLRDIYSWVVCLWGGRVSTPWGTYEGEIQGEVYNRIWDAVHLLQPPDLPPVPASFSGRGGILLAGPTDKKFLHISQPRWRVMKGEI